jgi:hypothetical protein
LGAKACLLGDSSSSRHITAYPPKTPLTTSKTDTLHLQIDAKCMSLCMSSIWTDIARIRTDMDSDPKFCLKNRVYELGNEDLNLD